MTFPEQSPFHVSSYRRICASIGFYWIIAAILAATSITSPARAQISVSPLHGVIEGTDTGAEFILSNSAQHSVRVRISLTDLEATPTGYVSPSDTQRRQTSAAPWLIVGPVKMILGPGERRPVNVQKRQTVPIFRGERRSHLLIETLPARAPFMKIADRPSGLSADLGIAISVPIILRTEPTPRPGPGTVTIIDTTLARDENNQIELTTTLSAEAYAYSLRGDVVVRHQSDGDKKSDPNREIARLDDVVIYPDHHARQVTLNLGN